MKKIINWTFGSVFRTFGRVLAYILIGTLVSLLLSKTGVKITDLFGIYTIKAKSVSITSQTYSIRHISMNNYEYLWTSYVSNGTQTQINTNTYATRGFRTKFYSSAKFEKDQSYQAKVRLNSTPKGTYEATYPYTEFSCYGSLSNSNYSAETSLIKSCQLVSVVIESGNNYTDYYINFTPNSNIEVVQFVILWELNQPMERINIDSSSSISYDTSTQDAINSQTDSLINNQNSNTNSIINNQNSNTQDIIENAKNNLYSNCSKGYRYFLIGSDKSYIQSSSNNVSNNNNYFITQPIRLYPNESYTLNIVNATNIQSGYYCFFNKNMERISCTKYSDNTTTTYTFTTPANTYFATFTLYRSNEVMLNATIKGNTCVLDTYETDVKNFRNTQELNNSLTDLNDSLNDDDSSEATSEINDFFSNFSTNNHGLTGIISAPLNAINSLTSKTCSPLVLPLPFVNQNLTLPCMRNIYVQNFGAFMNLYDVITLGIISYWVMVRIFNLVKDFKNPEHDEVEVMDL